MRKFYSIEFNLKAASMGLNEGQPVLEACTNLDPCHSRWWAYP